MKLYANCSEALYRIKSEELNKLSKKAKKIFDEIVEAYTNNPDLIDGVPGFDINGNFEWRPYFEKPVLDLFLDYFGVKSERIHWTTSGTTYMDKKTYNKLMREFCKANNLKFKDIYKKRYIDK